MAEQKIRESREAIEQSKQRVKIIKSETGAGTKTTKTKKKTKTKTKSPTKKKRKY